MPYLSFLICFGIICGFKIRFDDLCNSKWSRLIGSFLTYGGLSNSNFSINSNDGNCM